MPPVSQAAIAQHMLSHLQHFRRGGVQPVLPPAMARGPGVVAAKVAELDTQFVACDRVK